VSGNGEGGEKPSFCFLKVGRGKKGGRLDREGKGRRRIIREKEALNGRA